MLGNDPMFSDVLVISGADEFVRRVRSLLLAAGYTVRSSGSAAAALAAARSTPPDLVLQDAHLADGDGYAIVRTLKADAGRPFLPIIMVSSQDDPVDIAAALDAGADEFMLQSASHVELLTRVRAMLRLKRATDALTELNATLEEKVAERSRELEQALASLHHAQKLASLGRMGAAIAHEINNPVTGILGLLELIREDCPAHCSVNPNLQPDVSKVEQQIHIIARLVQNLRDFAKPPRRERRPVVLNAVVEDVLALAGKQLQHRHVRVERALDPDLPPVLASAEQMGQVLLNLILNAQDAMPEGGTLTVRTARAPAGVQIQVADTGTGIPPETRDHVFEPFFTTKGEHGTGLGLSICHSIVRDHGGEIVVESRAGQGTTFTIDLPLAAAGQQPPDGAQDVY